MGKRGPKPLTYEERIRAFWSYVDVRGENDCWEWHGATTERGYGVYGLDGHQTTAHRIAYLITNGNPDHKDVCHTCDNPPCCNPNHLFKGTRSENMQDMSSKGRHWLRNKAMTHDIAIEIRKMYSSGEYTLNELGRIYEMHGVSIRNIVLNISWHDPIYSAPATIAKQQSGERNPRTNLTWAQVRGIRKAHKDGTETYRAIGDRFGASESQVWGIVNNKTWKE